MDRDKILRLAREAGFEQQMRHRDGGVTVLPDALFVRFATLVRAEALEEAAKVCEAKGPELLRWWGGGASNAAAQECASSIRALKEQQ